MALRLTSMHVMDDEENENKRNGLFGVNRLKAMKEGQEDVPQPAANRSEPETEPTGVARLQALKNGQKQTTVTPAPETPAPETPAPAAQQGRIRPGWDTADAAGASEAQDRRGKPFTAAADDLRRLNDAAGVNIDDLREDLTQRAAERDAADSALGQIVEPWNRANATAQNLRSQVAAYETKLGMLQDTMDNSDDPEERRRAQQEARALDLGYQKAQRAAERYESRYNELNTQFQQLAIARNKANRALETGLEQYDTLLSLGDKRAANYEQQARDLRDRYNAAYQSGMPNAWELQRQAENAEAKAAAERQNYAEYLAKTKGEGYANRYLQGIEDGNRAKAEKASFGEKVLNTVAGLGENFFSGVGGAPWIFMARLMEIPEDALYAITGNEAFNQDAPGRGARTSQILQTNDPFRSDAEARKQRAGSLGGMLIDTGYAAGNMLGMTGLAGQVTGALSNTALMSKLSSIAESSTLATSPAARRGAQMAINALRSPGNLGVSLSSGVSSYSEALANGASFSQAMANGISKAVTEYVSNRLFSGMPLENAPGEKGYVTKAIEFLADKLGKSEALAAFNRSTGGKVLGWIYDKAGEGLEEVVTGLLDPIIDRMTYDKEADWLPKLDQLADEFLGGVMLSLLMSGGEAVLAPSMTRAQIAEDLVRQGVPTAEARKYAGMIYKDMKAAERAQKAVQEAAEADITEAPEAAAPVAAPTQAEAPAQVETPVQPVSPLQAAVDKLTGGEQLTQNDGRRILRDETAMQTLRDAGVLTETVRDDAAGRQTVRQAVEQYVAQQAENRAPEEQTAENGPPVPGEVRNAAETAGTVQETEAIPQAAAENRTETRTETAESPTGRARLEAAMAAEGQTAGEATPRTEGLRLPTAEETLTPAPERVNLLAQTRTEVNDNGTQTPAPSPAEQRTAPAPEAGTVRNAPAEQSFAERARAAAETERSRAILDRSERRTGLGRFLQNYRETRAQQRTDQQFAAQKQRAAQLQHQADARDLAYTSAAELGVAGGTEKSTMQVIPQDMLDRNQLAAKQAAARDGVDLQFVLGQGEALDDNGAAYNFRGWISADGKRMIIQADHSKLTWQQILSHEELHKLIKSDPEYRRTAEDALLSDKKLQPYLGGIVDRYVAAYHDMQVFDENEIIEEMLADYRAGFDMLDIYHGTAGNVAAKKAAAKDIRAAEKALENRVNEQRPVSVADETKASREFNAKYMAAAVQFNEASKHVPESLMNDVAKVREVIKDKLDEIQNEARLPADVEGNTYFGNGSYNGSEESTTVCPRSLSVDALADAVGEALGRPLTVEESVYVAQQAFHFTDIPQCLYCYVAMDRMAKRQLLGEYINKRTQVLTDIQNGMSRDEAFAAFKKRETAGGKQWSKNKQARFDMWVRNFENGAPAVRMSNLASEDAVEKALRDPSLKAEMEDALQYAQNASWAKKRVGYTAYNGHILKWDQKRVDSLNAMFGLRLYSFSDYSPAYILENMQMVTDAAVRGLKMLAYTKELDFVKIFAGTGMNINISTFGMDGGDGSVHEDAMQGAAWKEAQELRKEFPNVGITFVATNDNQVNWAIDQDWIDVVIPFHMVKTGATVANILGYQNYTGESSDKKIQGIKARQKEIFPSQHQNNKEKYLAALEKAHLTPRFERWLEHPNYMKLVNETRRSAEDTPAVQPKFDQKAVDAALKSLDDMVKRGGYGVPIGGSLENLADIALEMSDDIRKGIAQDLKEHNRQKGKASRELDDSYLAAVEAGDMETAQRMVDEAAKQAGYNRIGDYYVGNQIGLTEPEPTKRQMQAYELGQKYGDTDAGYRRLLMDDPDTYERIINNSTLERWYLAGTRGTMPEYRLAIRYGDIPEGSRSRNWGTGELERGTSVVDFLTSKTQNGKTIYDTIYGMQNTSKNIVGGWDFGIFGSDGEPLLVDAQPVVAFSDVAKIKSAAPVTYDDDGNVIPLNERFNTEEPDIRYSREIDPEEAARAETRALQPVSPGSYTGGPRSRGRSTRGPKEKVSRVRTHAFELGGLYNEVESQMAETQPEEFTYDPISEKRSMNEALGRLKKDFDGEAEKLASSDQWGGSDLDTAMGILYQYRQIGRETGDYSLFNEWSHVIQQKGTKGGQFVQAFAKYSRTATGVAQKAAENLRDTAGKLNPKQQKLIEGHVSDILGAVDNDTEAAARDAVEKSKGKNGLRLPGGNDTQRVRDAENVIKQIHKIFSQQTRRSHGLPVEEWTKATGDQLAGRIASRLKDPGTKTQTTMQTILGDLITFAQEHALPTQEARQHRTALDRITDYLNNREAYAEAWGEAKQVLRDMYADDPEKLDALESFLSATITYNGDDFDRTMFRAILEASDLLGMDKQDILNLAAVGTTESVINRIADEFVRRVGVDDATLRDTVRRHIENIVRESNVDGRLERMESEASKELDIKIQDLLRESRRTKADAANRIAQYLINDLGISGTDAAIAANHIAGHYMDQLQQRADRVVERMFAEKKAITKKQRDKLLDLIHLGGLTNANVEDAVVDALGLSKLTRAKQRQIMDAMAQFADTLDAIEDNDLEGLRQLIREQAAVRNTKLDRLAEKVLSGETDAEYLRSLAMAQLDLIAADYRARTAGEKISTVQVISHLLNARTAMRNLGSNQIFDLVDSLANNAGLLPDMIMSKITGQRSVGLNRSWASQQKRQGAIKGASRNLLEIALDAAPNDRNQSKYGTGGRRTFSMANSGTAGKILSKLEQVLGYELNTTDELHKGSVFGETIESLSRWVDAGYVTLEEAEEFATEMALYRSFQDSTIVGSILGGLKDVMNIVGTGKTNGKTIKGMPVHDWGLGDLVVKYTQVPGALVHRAIEYSPVGYLKAIYHMAQLANAKTKGEGTIKQQRKAALALGRATTGTGLITLFALMAKAGLLRRGDDEKDKNAAALKTSQGLSGTQLNLTAIERLFAGESTDPQKGDVLADIGFLEPLDSLMTIAALINNDPELKGHDLYEFFHDPKTASKTLEKSLEGIWLALENTSAMQTLSNIYSTVRYHDEENDLPLYLQIPLEIASSNISGFIPAPVRQIAQATDTTYRDQYRSHNFFSQTGAKVANAIPGLRQQLAPKITPLGEDKQYQAPVLNALNALLNPGNISVYQTTDVIDELDRVYAETGDAKIWPERNAPYKTTINKESYTLTPDERTQYQRTRGQLTGQMMDAVMGADWYKSMDEAQKADVLNWIGNFSNYVAKVEFSEGRGMDYASDTYDKYYRAMLSGTPLEDVVAEAKGKIVEPARQTVAAEATIAAAKIPEASKQEAETMSAEAKRLYAGFLKGGVSDSTARDLATKLEGSTATGHEQWREVYDAAGKEGEKAVTSVMTDDMRRNWNLAKDAGVNMDDYIRVRENYQDLDGNGKQKQAEWNATLDSFIFDKDPAKDKQIKGTLWQILTGSSSTKNNPYDKAAGQAVIDAKEKGGSSGAGKTYSMGGLRLPTPERREPISSGLKLQSTPAAKPSTGGLKLR